MPDIMLLPLFILCLSATGMCRQNFITKTNFGVLLTEVATLDATYNTYHFSYSFEWPGHLDLSARELFKCHEYDKDNQTIFLQQCDKLELMINEMYDDTERLALQVNSTIATLRDLLPYYDPSIRDKRRLSFIGRGLEKAFGLVSHKTFKTLSDHVDYVEEKGNIIGTNLMRFGQELSSLVRITDHRFANIISNINKNNDEITKQVNTIAQVVNTNVNRFLSNMKLFRAFELQITRTFTMCFEQISNGMSLMVSAENLLINWLLGGQTLINGRLPISIVHPSAITEMLDHISDQISDLGYKITYPELSYYYNSVRLVATHTDNHLYITLEVPIHKQLSFFTLYQVFSFPLSTPLNKSTTEIQNLPDHDLYTLQDTFVTCSSPIPLKCQQMFNFICQQ